MNAIRPALEAIKAMPGFQNKRIIPSTIRCEVQLAALNQYPFYILAPDGGSINQLVTPNEVRLDKSDAFVATQMAIMIYKAGASTTPTNAELSSGILRTFPNPNVFTGAAEAVNLQALYNQGQLTVVVNNDEYYDNFELWRFYRAPQSQQGVGSSATSNVPITRDQYDLNTTPFVNLDRPIIYNGNSKIDVNINLRVAISMVGTSSANYAVLIQRGYLVVGANSTQAPVQR